MPFYAKAADEKTFLAGRRDLMLGYPRYLELRTDQLETFDVVGRSLGNAAVLETLSADRPMIAAHQRASDAVSYLHLDYSAGGNARDLEAFFQYALKYWESYANYHEAFHRTPAAPYMVAHITLQDAEYWDAIRLTSFAILLGHADKLSRLCAIWDYGDQTLDGLLERLVAPFVPGRAPPPDKCTKHLPYFKLLKVFAAVPEKCPALMVKYLDEWYEASRREPYYRSHTQGREHSYLGYWSFEAAAVTIVLGIDDSSYREKNFYPRDLADFARSIRAGRTADERYIEETQRLRCPAGQPCPREGYWFTPAAFGAPQRFFKYGEIMPEIKSDYGSTIWQWSLSQSPPRR